MTSPSEDGGRLDPVIEIWVTNDDSGSQSVFVTGEGSDGQRFFGSFFQPTLKNNHDEEDGDVW